MNELKLNKQTFTVLLISIVLIVCAGCSSNKSVSGAWSPRSLTIDGKGSEWEAVSTTYDEKIGAVYGVVNDDSGIHVMVRFNDARTVRRINRFGLVLWFNSDDSKDRNFGVRYAAPRRLSQGEGEMLRRPRERENDESKPAQLDGIFSVIDSDTTLITAARNNALSTAVASDNGLYCFEVSVPYAFGEHFSSKPGDVINLGIELSGMPKEMRERMKERMSEGRGGGRGGGGRARGGRGGGGRSGGAPGGRMPDLEKKDIWITLDLARKSS